MKCYFYRIWGVVGIVFYLMSACLVIWRDEVGGVFYVVMSSVFLSFSYIAHLQVVNRFLRNYINIKKIDYFLIRIVVWSILIFGFSLLPSFYGLISGPYIFEGRSGLVIKIFDYYWFILFFSLALCAYGRLILEQKLLPVYKRMALFKSYLILAALIQPILRFCPSFISIALFITGILSVLPLLSHLRWVAVLSMRDKWIILFCLSILNLLSLFFGQKILQIQLMGFIQPYFWNNIFGLTVLFTVFVYGILSWLALVFSMPLASFIDEQRSEIAAFQEMTKSLATKDNTFGVWERLFEACYKNTGSEAGWLVTYSGSAGMAESPLIVRNISSEQVAALYIKSNIREVISTTDGGEYSFAHYIPDLHKKGLEAVANLPYRSLLVLTVYHGHNKHLKAIICLVKSFSDGYSRYMTELCQSYIAQANLALENMQLVSETVQSERVRRELEIAGKVQQALMPKKFPENFYCEIAGYNEPAVEVGGDYYDYCRIDEHRMAFIIGDVSGKGASAAFHMAQMKGIFQSLLQFTSNAEQFMVHANHAVARCMEKSRFISVILLLLDFEQRIFTYSRAGHCPLLYYNAQNKTIEILTGQGMALGIIRNNDYERFIEAINQPIHIDDVFLLYTDGLVEARRKGTDEQFGYERLKGALEASSILTAEEIAQRIYNDFRVFSVGSEFKDDTSFLVIKIKG